MGDATSRRSARRTTVRARSRAADARFAPGMTNSVGMETREIRSSICTSRAATISSVTRVVPATSFDRWDGSVATSAIST